MLFLNLSCVDCFVSHSSCHFVKEMTANINSVLVRNDWCIAWKNGKIKIKIRISTKPLLAVHR